MKLEASISQLMNMERSFYTGLMADQSRDILKISYIFFENNENI